MDLHYEFRTTDEENQDFFSNAECLKQEMILYASKSKFADDRIVNLSCSSEEQLEDKKLVRPNVLSIDFPGKKTRNTYLFFKEVPKEEHHVLLINGEIKTTDLKWDELIGVLMGQIEADEKAFKLRHICYPVYEMLRTVSKIIKDRKKVYSVIVTGKREFSYLNDNAGDDEIHVNTEEGCFRLVKSNTYIEYTTSFDMENRRDIRRNRCYTFADRLNCDLALALDKAEIKETLNDCEIIVYLGRGEVRILCGRGDETKVSHAINKVGSNIDVKVNTIAIPK